MRAVKAVLQAVSSIKLRFPTEGEENVILRSIIEINLPKLLNHDVKLFEDIISDIFKKTAQPESKYDRFKEAVEEVSYI